MKGATTTFNSSTARAAAIFSASLVCLLMLWSLPSGAQTAGPSSSPAPGQFVLSLGDPDEGRALFTSKGCVICHAVNDVGGRVGPPLDLQKGRRYLNLFDFVARMWRGASTMIVLQEMQLGYQIQFSGDDLAHIAAFLANPEAQRALTRDQIPPNVQQWMLEDVYRHLENEVIPQ